MDESESTTSEPIKSHSSGGGRKRKAAENVHDGGDDYDTCAARGVRRATENERMNEIEGKAAENVHDREDDVHDGEDGYDTEATENERMDESESKTAENLRKRRYWSRR